MSRLRVLVLTLAFALCVPFAFPPFLTVSAHAANISSIRLTAERTVLRADGQSTTIITATVYDDRGNLVADGSRINFSTTAGRLDTYTTVTQSGTARVILTAPDQPTEALVSAVLETPGATVPQNITITFSRDADSADTGSGWASINGPYVAYVQSFQTIQAISTKRGTARFTYRGLTVTGQILQIDAAQNILVARGDVTLAKNGVTHSYRSLRYALLQGEGSGERLEDERLQVVMIHGMNLIETPPPKGTPPPAPELYDLQDLSDPNLLTFVAKSIALEPLKQLQLRSVTLYAQSTKVWYLPFHIIGIGQKTLFPDQIVGLSSQGPTINVPFYPYVQPNAVSTIHLRRGAPVGSSAYAVRPGWNVDLSEAYTGPHSVEGNADIYGVTRSGWNAQFHHGQRLDANATGSVYLNLSGLNSALLSTELTHNYPHFQLNATGAADRAGDVVDPITGVRGQPSGDLRGQLNAQTYSRPLWGVKQVLFSLDTNVSRQGFFGDGVAVQQGTIITQAMGGRVFTTPIPVAPATTATQSVNLSQTWIQGKVATLNGIPAAGIALQSQTSLNHQLGRMGSTSVSYYYTQTPQVLTSGIVTTNLGVGHQRLGFSLNLAQTDQWNLSVTGSHGLDLDQSTIYTTASYHIGGPWRGSVVINDDTIQGIHYRDIEYRLSRRFSQLGDISAYYSTTAKRVQLDFSALRF